MKNRYIYSFLAAATVLLMAGCTGKDKIKTLIISGQGKDQLAWMTRSAAVKNILDDAGLFSTKLITTPPEGEDMSKFNPKFGSYNLVVIDYEGDTWPEKTEAALKEFIEKGGGIVRIQSLNDAGSPLPSSITFSRKHDFEVRMQATDHPVVKGLPLKWLHPDDVIVQGMPLGDDVQVLATAFSDTSYAGSGIPEPVLLAATKGEGREFWTLLGTPDLDENKALKCAGFIITLQRGAEWAATGNVKQEVPFDFPTASGVMLRADFMGMTFDEAFKGMAEYKIASSTKYLTYIQHQLRKAKGDAKTLSVIERRMVDILENPEATVDAKRLLLRELSWMGTEFCVPAIKALADVPELKDDVDFALTRLQ